MVQATNQPGARPILAARHGTPRQGSEHSGYGKETQREGEAGRS